MTKEIKYLYIITLLILISSCNPKSQPAKNKLEYIPFSQVDLNAGFFYSRQLLVHSVTIPHILDMCETTGRIKNFRIAGGLEKGSYCTKFHFDDSDVYKAIEAASYSLSKFPNPQLDARINLIIKYIAAAQEEDGYIYTNRTIMGDSAHIKAGPERWVFADQKSHELYNMGHLIEAGITHYQCTGKKTLLNIAIKSADLICNTFGYGKTEKFPGHEEIEIALLRLYKLTGDIKYLDQAEFFLAVRGPGGDPYKQAHLKVNKQFEAKGHAVRAMYLYTAMKNLALLKKKKDYDIALDSLWKDVVYKKMYITGGIGPGKGYGEGFGPAYHLPDSTAYCETCSSVGNFLWNSAMFLGNPRSEYFDVAEKILYNSFLSGLGMNGNTFFYTNRLSSSGNISRKQWYPCSCCPPNIARLISSVSGYFYAKKENEVYVNLYNTSQSSIKIQSGENIKISQYTSYPWSGKIKIKVKSSAHSHLILKLRIPGWSYNCALPGRLYNFRDTTDSGFQLFLNHTEINPEVDNGYAVIKEEWTGNDVIELNFELPVRKVKANHLLKDIQGKTTIQRGPVIYCMEGIDQRNKTIENKTIPDNTSFNQEITCINQENFISLSSKDGELKLIPYFAWANRGPVPMKVWIPSD